MNINHYLVIAPFINDCPSCGNGIVGNGQGTLNVDDDIISRTCKCGFKFEYDVANGVSKNKIKNAVNTALGKGVSK